MVSTGDIPRSHTTQSLLVCLLLLPPSQTLSSPNIHQDTQTYGHPDVQQDYRMFGSLSGESGHAKNEGKGLDPQHLFGDSGKEMPEWLQSLCLGAGDVTVSSQGLDGVLG